VGGSIGDWVTAVRGPKPRCPGSATELSGTIRSGVIILGRLGDAVEPCVGVAPPSDLAVAAAWLVAGW
jgi:hypothetical protein